MHDSLDNSGSETGQHDGDLLPSTSQRRLRILSIFSLVLIAFAVVLLLLVLFMAISTPGTLQVEAPRETHDENVMVIFKLPN